MSCMFRPLAATVLAIALALPLAAQARDDVTITYRDACLMSPSPPHAGEKGPKADEGELFALD